MNDGQTWDGALLENVAKGFLALEGVTDDGGITFSLTDDGARVAQILVELMGVPVEELDHYSLSLEELASRVQDWMDESG